MFDSLSLFLKAYLKLFGKWYKFYFKLFKNNLEWFFSGGGRVV